MSFLSLKGVCKGYGTGANRSEVLTNLELEVAEGEFVAIVGFSGSGKTTLISAIAGLVQPDAGEITLKGRPVTGPGPDRGVVFQSYSLMPWLSVRGNVALAVDQVFARESRANRAVRVDRYIELVGLSHAAARLPSELSGGMRQRVAVARALAASPEILLLDEPLSALDALTRAKLQDEIIDIWSRDKRTVVLITNDVDEAILLADRIIPLLPGPNASLGKEFTVDIARPRQRSSINEDLNFKRLRQAVTNYLMDAVAERTASSVTAARTLPNVVPITQMEKPPSAYQRAATSVSRSLDRYLEYSRLSKIYPTPTGPLTVVDNFDLKVRKGEFVTVIGHSGCGKSTVLSMTAGLNEVSLGGIILDGREVSAAGPDRAVVFQAPSLFPWLTARENVALGVDRVYPHAKRQERDEIVDYYLERVGLADSLDKPAVAMSNGMRQRVGIARAFALSPKLLLLDEPFGMLDSLTRWDLQEVLMEVWARTQVTALCVTHDVDEAILLADRVVMMTNGPNARIGHIMHVDIPRPRTRKALLEHPNYYRYRRELLDFLEAYEHGAAPKEPASVASPEAA
ncbi:ABC transporter ATP-binding protein [Bradyrhizobium cenepequi]|uniref:ABC transporter ATP-binding protein n=1 Tax=Bradyrhizobium cenepequi TaxID=2821403 RepID=UPI001CE36B9B|nr:nitrate ABC transporter ATP-binding protein [Bradyrhizobium cenepequi]MCA6111835.1 ATP-binding cassette domain-containing protein [Bradyrhizobium cenepequi]